MIELRFLLELICATAGFFAAIFSACSFFLKGNLRSSYIDFLKISASVFIATLIGAAVTPNDYENSSKREAAFESE